MIRAGIVGAGVIAGVHASAYAAQPNVELAVIADPRIDHAERLAGTYGAQAVGSIAELLSSDVDVVSICTPTPTHAELSIAAMRAGKHVLCEKPVARTLEQAEAMVAAARECGVKFTVGHVSRYEVDHRASRAVLERGDLGELRMAFQSITAPFPDWSSRGWFGDVQQSGGPVLDLAIHSIDYFLWLYRRPVTRVSAVGARGKLDFDAYALVTLAFRGGGMALVEASWAHPRAHGLMVRTELSGTRGRLDWDYTDITAMQIIRDEDGKRDLLMVGENSFADEIADFVRCVEQDTPPPIPGEQAAEALRVGLAALESLESGRTVNL